MTEIVDDNSDFEITSEQVITDALDNSQVQPQEIIQDGDDADFDEKLQINYRNWKINSIKLYDYLNTTNLVWPSLSVEFFPDIETIDSSNKFRILTSTYTSSEFENHLQIGSFKTRNQIEEVSLNKFDPLLNEFQSSHSISSYSIDQSILHKGDINKSSILPQNPDIISTINNFGEIFIFDKTKHSSININNEFKCEIKLNSGSSEGFGLNWNNNVEGLLISSSINGETTIFDIKKYVNNEKLSPLNIIKSDNDGTNDVQWNPLHDSIFGTVGEDNTVKIFDTRSLGDPIKRTSSHFHSDGINSLSFNYHNSFILSTVDSIGNLNIWDLRNISKPSISISNAHKGSISCIQFNPNRPNLLATGGSDENIINIWDLSKSKDEQLIFKHGGHLLGINDFNWNPHDDLMIASVSNDNTLQIWKPSSEFF